MTDGILTTALLIALQHIFLYKRLEKHTFSKFMLGTAAILAGCGVIAAEHNALGVFIVPFFCAASAGTVVGLCYIFRALFDREIGNVGTREYLKGLADKGDIAHERETGE